MFPRYSVWESLLAQNTLVWALVSTLFHSRCFIRVWVKTQCNPRLIQRGYMMIYGDMNNVDIMGKLYIHVHTHIYIYIRTYFYKI